MVVWHGDGGGEEGGWGSQKPQPCAVAVWARLNGLSQGARAVKR